MLKPAADELLSLPVSQRQISAADCTKPAADELLSAPEFLRLISAAD